MSIEAQPPPAGNGTMRVAFYGRVSTDDQQDPSLSIPRQLRKCKEALAPIGEEVGPTYWEEIVWSAGFRTGHLDRRESAVRGPGGRRLMAPPRRLPAIGKVDGSDEPLSGTASGED
jgi:hypothetical protein